MGLRASRDVDGGNRNRRRTSPGNGNVQPPPRHCVDTNHGGRSIISVVFRDALICGIHLLLEVGACGRFDPPGRNADIHNSNVLKETYRGRRQDKFRRQAQQTHGRCVSGRGPKPLSISTTRRRRQDIHHSTVPLNAGGTLPTHNPRSKLLDRASSFCKAGLYSMAVSKRTTQPPKLTR